MIQLVVLGAAVAFLALSKKPNAPVAIAKPADDVITPTFADVPLTGKTKEPTPVLAVGPVAEGVAPPYVCAYPGGGSTVPEFSAFGALDSPME